jgi:hypothetical protein
MFNTVRINIDRDTQLKLKPYVAFEWKLTMTTLPLVFMGTQINLMLRACLDDVF